MVDEYSPDHFRETWTHGSRDDGAMLPWRLDF